MKEAARWNKGQTVYTRSGWPKRKLHVRSSRRMRSVIDDPARFAEVSDSVALLALLPWEPSGTWHALAGGDAGDPMAVIEGPRGEVVVVDELAGPWHAVRYGAPSTPPATAPHGGDRDWFVALWLPRESGRTEVTFSVAMDRNEAEKELRGYRALGYKGSVARPQETVTYPG